MYISLAKPKKRKKYNTEVTIAVNVQLCHDNFPAAGVAANKFRQFHGAAPSGDEVPVVHAQRTATGQR